MFQNTTVISFSCYHFILFSVTFHFVSPLFHVIGEVQFHLLHRHHPIFLQSVGGRIHENWEQKRQHQENKLEKGFSKCVPPLEHSICSCQNKLVLLLPYSSSRQEDDGTAYVGTQRSFLEMDFIRTFYSTTSYYWEEKSKGHFVSKMMNVNEWNGPLPCTISPFFPPASYLFLAEALPDAVPTFEAKLSKVKAKIAFRLFSSMFAISSLKRKNSRPTFWKSTIVL